MKSSKVGGGNSRVTTRDGKTTKDVTYTGDGRASVEYHEGGRTRSYDGVVNITGGVTPLRRK